MKTKWILLVVSIMCTTWMLHADETITVTATAPDISENLNLKTVATLFGQCKDLEQFELLLNHPDSAFSNLDLNGDGEVDYLRVVETAEGSKHLVVIQAVLAKDIYQDVASIFVEKDNRTNSVTVQVIGDEYIYGTNYIIEPVYIYRPLIYDWFWGPSWVCWHSPYYWGYYPHHWRPYHCVDLYHYWNHCYWHHYHHPICSYRHVHRPHRHYHDMHHHVRRNDYAHRHPERSFATRNASRNVSNARSIEQTRRAEMRQHMDDASRTQVSGTRQGGTATGTRSNTYGSTNVRQTTSTTRTSAAGAGTGTRSSATGVRTSTTGSGTRSTSTSVRTSTTGTSTRSTGTSVRTSTTGTSVRSTGTSVRTSTTGTSVRSTGTSTRSTSTSTSTSTRSTSTRSSSVGTSTSTRSSVSGGGYSGGSRSGSGGYSGGSTRTSSGGGSRTR